MTVVSAIILLLSSLGMVVSIMLIFAAMVQAIFQGERRNSVSHKWEDPFRKERHESFKIAGFGVLGLVISLTIYLYNIQ